MKKYKTFVQSSILTLAFLFFADKLYRLIRLHTNKHNVTSKSNNSEIDRSLFYTNKSFSIAHNIHKQDNQNLNTISSNNKNEKIIIKSIVKEIINDTNTNEQITISKIHDNDKVDKTRNNTIIDESNNYNNNYNNKINNNNQHDNINTCDKDQQTIYMKTPDIPNDQLEFCKIAHNSYRVIVGHSWGNLPKNMQSKWNDYNCNQLITVGRLLSCNDTWGWPFLFSWVAENNVKTYITNNNKTKLSNIRCGSNSKNSIFCKMINVRLDFSKSIIHGDSRTFEDGFLTTYGIQNQEIFYGSPNHKHIDSNENPNIKWMDKEECDIIENRPTFLTSNDDIFNLAHYINDVMDLWTIIILSGKNSKDSNLINMDGYRKGGPASNAQHRLMLRSQPDYHGPFISYYKSWFANITKAIDYENEKVCYKELYLPHFPGVAWYWFGWGGVPAIECTLKGPSPIFQSFNYFLLNRWKEYNGMNSLKPPSKETIKIVLEVRPFNPNKPGLLSSSRVIKNLEEVINTLKSIQGVTIVSQNFVEIPFEDQVALVHSSSIYISMHGAGTVHMTHMAIGSTNCCALLELQPDTSFGFVAANGNYARSLGLHFFSYEAKKEDTSDDGTFIDVKKLKELVSKAIDSIQTKPTCLNDVRDMNDVTKHFKNL